MDKVNFCWLFFHLITDCEFCNIPMCLIHLMLQLCGVNKWSEWSAATGVRGRIYRQRNVKYIWVIYRSLCVCGSCLSNLKAENYTYITVMCIVYLCIGPEVYSFPFFTEEFCEQFTAELDHIESSPVPKGQPNSMNNYGVSLWPIHTDVYDTHV